MLRILREARRKGGLEIDRWRLSMKEIDGKDMTLHYLISLTSINTSVLVNNNTRIHGDAGKVRVFEG